MLAKIRSRTTYHNQGQVASFFAGMISCYLFALLPDPPPSSSEENIAAGCALFFVREVAFEIRMIYTSRLCEKGENSFVIPTFNHLGALVLQAIPFVLSTQIISWTDFFCQYQTACEYRIVQRRVHDTSRRNNG